MINGHDIPAINYFENKNVFFGSEGGNFRYRIENSDGLLKAQIWYEDICFELANIEKSETFELSTPGLSQAVDWVFNNK